MKAWGISWRSYQESYIDALGPFAEVVIALLSSIAKMEREKIRERTLAGLERAPEAHGDGGALGEALPDFPGRLDTA